ncbi:MAG: dephospho-CoA kinase [Acaryochloridaceae cyanobacterium SU_2_1]|nr:dephospho-CoA kinase [Acaryochloridaceae cyanobacterium SU_2_1]
MSQRQIGLTGGIATGKTRVTRYLAEQYGLPILDADLFAREAVAIGSPILAAISARYGSQILAPEGELDRRQLGRIIFDDPRERRWLERQIHPYVRDRIRIGQGDLTASPIIVMVVPLLFEAQMTDLVTEIWVVTCSLAQQVERLRRRDQLSDQEARARVDSQMPLKEKVRRAHIVIENGGSLADLYRAVDRAVLGSQA